jgi:hypothetical protein
MKEKFIKPTGLITPENMVDLIITPKRRRLVW